MKSWYKVVEDLPLKDGSTIKRDKLVFETTDKDMSKRVEKFFELLMDENCQREEVYPLTIVMDRYEGTYSGGYYTAWNLDVEDVPTEIESDDVTCYNFWHSYEGVVGLGRTPNEATEDLRRKLNLEKV